MKPYVLVAALIILSCWTLWCRYREGRLFTPSSGLHLQFLVFFGMGGFGFALFPNAEPHLSKLEIIESILQCIPPLLGGYAIAIGIERFYFRRKRRIETVMTRGGTFSPVVIFFVALLGFAGCLLEGELLIPGLSSLPTYCKNLFFPCFLLAIINARSYGIHGILVSVLIVIMAIVIGIWSPWRSVLIILAATILLAVILMRPKWIPVTLVAGVIAMGLLIPFQNAKKIGYEEFVADPYLLVEQTLDMKMGERWEGVGDFVAKRINYVRELVYVNRALQAGMPLENGETYLQIFYQLVPRFLWQDKPEIQERAGFFLPREVGLLQKVDVSTSWAVNSSAEATYNFGLKSLIWFIPVMFLLAEGMEKIMRRITLTPQAGVLGNISLFYLYLGHTSAIFAASMIVALIVIIKGVDLALVYTGVSSRQDIKTGLRRAVSNLPGTKQTAYRIRGS